MARVDAREPWTLLYDGSCGICRAGGGRFVRLAAPGAIELADFRAPGVRARFPQVTPEQCERAMQLVAADGSEVHAGAAAVVAALNTRPAWRRVTWLYRVPGIRQLADWSYRRMANNRFAVSRVLGLRASDCESGSCTLHEHRP